MHGISAHSAMAIKRQRRQRAAQKRGHKTQAQTDASRQASMSNKVMGTITMFHVGGVFLTVGIFLMLAAVITNETNKAEMAELVGTGVVCLVIGLFLVILNRFYGQREEEELQNYVETRLARTRSGQRLYHDSDSYPEHLDNCSKTTSMDSGLSNDYDNSKKSRFGRNKKNKKAGIEAPTPVAPTTSVNIINEHNHHQQQQQMHRNNSSGSRHGSAGGVDDISPAGVTLERISEEQELARSMQHHQSQHRQHQHQSQQSHHHPERTSSTSSYHQYEDSSGLSRHGSAGGSGNLYRVYDATTA